MSKSKSKSMTTKDVARIMRATAKSSKTGGVPKGSFPARAQKAVSKK